MGWKEVVNKAVQAIKNLDKKETEWEEKLWKGSSPEAWLEKQAKKAGMRLQYTGRSICDLYKEIREGKFGFEILDSETKVFEGVKYNLIKTDLMGLAFGVRASIPVTVVRKDYTGIHIFVNKGFQHAQPAVQEAILAHEIGHVVLGHLEDPKETTRLNIRRILGDLPAIELEADDWAKEKGYKIKEALQEINDAFQAEGIEHPELATRIARLG